MRNLAGINPVTTERTLSRYFVRFGRLVDCFIAKTPGAGPNFAPRSRGFGFVTFAHSSSADMVLRSGPHVIDDRALDVKSAVPKEMMGGAPGTTPPVFQVYSACKMFAIVVLDVAFCCCFFCSCYILDCCLDFCCGCGLILK